MHHGVNLASPLCEGDHHVAKICEGCHQPCALNDQSEELTSRVNWKHHATRRVVHVLKVLACDENHKISPCTM
jgi:hypothetical protein